MNKLENARLEIDEIDKQLVELIERRFTCVQDVIAYKKENDLPIFDGDREAIIIHKNVERIQNEEIKPYFKNLYEEMLKISKQYQQMILEREERN